MLITAHITQNIW